MAEIVEKYKVTTATVYRWLRASAAGDGLDCKPNRGRPWRLDDKDLERLEKLLIKGARKHGFDTDLWTLDRITIVIKRHFDVELHPTNVSKNLARMGWSTQ